MDREMIYAFIFEEVSYYENTVEGDIYTKNKIEILIRVSALTDAAFYSRIGVTEAKHLIRGYIASLKAPAPAVEPAPKDGSITF